jgi:hypothetical protein
MIRQYHIKRELQYALSEVEDRKTLRSILAFVYSPLLLLPMAAALLI